VRRSVLNPSLLKVSSRVIVPAQRIGRFTKGLAEEINVATVVRSGSSSVNSAPASGLRIGSAGGACSACCARLTRTSSLLWRP